ncbi:hypothetical protein K438DRAFT_1930904 [Mycena galopus ATCC 62051]|nr:hypothetical protein K438DRAFT_1930904 [Mycena galopus ATCC 62051]
MKGGKGGCQSFEEGYVKGGVKDGREWRAKGRQQTQEGWRIRERRSVFVEREGRKMGGRERSGDGDGEEGYAREDNGEGSDEPATYQQHAPAPRRTWTSTRHQHAGNRLRRRREFGGVVRYGGNTLEPGVSMVEDADDNDRNSQPGIKGNALKNGVGGAGGDGASVVPIAEEVNVCLGLAAHREA